jgi:hypothetical protein
MINSKSRKEVSWYSQKAREIWDWRRKKKRTSIIVLQKKSLGVAFKRVHGIIITLTQITAPTIYGIACLLSL